MASDSTAKADDSSTRPVNFIRHIIDDDLANQRHGGKVVTRFPPEPNGYLHIGHAKSICLNFGIGADYNGICHLRFDDTNPEKESDEYVRSIKEDVQWLGFDWQDKLFHASDHFDFLYESALTLIRKGKAYVDEQTADEIRANRGTLTEPGIPSPWRDRPAEENEALFERMRAGEFKDGERVLRAKIDMAAGNLSMRDPIIYRIRHITHHRTGDKWCLYPMYDFTHCLSDAREGVTHSLCTLEFEDNRVLYDWVLEAVGFDDPPRQYEFSRLNLEYTLMSKRFLNRLVTSNLVNGWDDPRMPTISGLRRRGYTPASVRDFCNRIGVTKSDNVIEMGVLESTIRDDLNQHAPRAMAVLKPLKIVIKNLGEDESMELTVPNHPGDDTMGQRTMMFTREIYVEQDDFMEDPPKKFFRLGPGREVRLRYGYCVTCNEVVYADDGTVSELRCSYDPETANGKTPDGRKVKGIIHWVSASYGQRATVRLYDRLFNTPTPQSAIEDMDNVESIRAALNPDSLNTIDNAIIEPLLIGASAGDAFQFERLGYFVVDAKDSVDKKPVFNRTVTLRDTWAKVKN